MHPRIQLAFLPPSRFWSLLHMKTAIFTSFPTGMPLPSPAVRPTTLATKALRVRYSLRTTPLIMVFSSGIPDPENNRRAGDEQSSQTNGVRQMRQTETDLAMPSALTNSLWRDEVAENGRKQNKNKWVCDPHQILHRNIRVQLSVHPLVGCRHTKKEVVSNHRCSKQAGRHYRITHLLNLPTLNLPGKLHPEACIF